MLLNFITDRIISFIKSYFRYFLYFERRLYVLSIFESKGMSYGITTAGLPRFAICLLEKLSQHIHSQITVHLRKGLGVG